MTDPLPYTILRSAIEPPTADFELDSYLMHRKTTHCNRCNSESTTSEIFEVQIHRARRIRRLVPAKSIREGLPVGLATLQVREQPACFTCFDTLPQEPPHSHFATEDEWRQTLKRKMQPAADAAKTPLPKEGPSLEEL